MENQQSKELLWLYPKENATWLSQIVREFKIHPITAQVLVARQFSDPEAIHKYFYAKLPDLYDPALFLKMDDAVKRIVRAIHNNEEILIYGDNDVDGMTGTALLTEFLRKVGARVHYFIPSHSIEKLDLYHHVIKEAEEKNISLVITVDTGITAWKDVEKLKKEEIDVIITDHHEPTESLPKCVAILNPKIPLQTYPNRELTGVGVAFKLAHAVTNYLVLKRVISKTKIDLKVFLDLVALGTIADMGVLLDENRIFVKYGLKQLEKTKRFGLLELFKISEVIPQRLSPFILASKIAPKMNSLGRIGTPIKGVELLLIKNLEAASKLAKELDLANLQRQKIEQQVSQDLEHVLSEQFNPNDKALILSSDGWHPGVIPILSARISKLYNRPTVLIAVDRGIGKGSIRTIPEFPLLPVLKKCSDLLINYGGHNFAAGLTIEQENITKLKKRLLHAANSSLKEVDLQQKLYLDAFAEFKDITYDLMASLELLEPYGNENPPPILYSDCTQAWPPKIISGSHLKLYLEQDERILEGIGFGMKDRIGELKKRNLKIRIAYTPQINQFQNKSSIQLLIKDFRVLESN